MKEWLITVTEYAVVAIDALALVIIVIGTIEAFIGGVRAMVIRVSRTIFAQPLPSWNEGATKKSVGTGLNGERL